MPYPAQTDRDAVVRTARALIETEGVDRLSLARLASELGIKAPSLYRHIPNKAALLQAVNLLTYRQLFLAYQTALRTAGDLPRERMLALFRAHRAFAHANPETYLLAYTTTVPEQRADERVLEQMALPIQELMSAISGPERSLAALRGALALVHGFVMLELKDQLKRAGNLTEAFEESIAAYVAGWQR